MHAADAGEMSLTNELEKEVIDFLLKKNGHGQELRTIVEYTGVFLDKPSKKKLMDAIFHPTVKQLEARRGVKQATTPPTTPATSATTTPDSPPQQQQSKEPVEKEKEKEEKQEQEKKAETEKEKKKEKGSKEKVDKEAQAKKAKEEKERKRKEAEDAIAIEDLSWTPKCHHLTMTLGAITEKTFAVHSGLDPQLHALGREVVLTVAAFGISKRAMAVKV